MEKTIKIGDKDVKLNNNIGWAFNYRDQFGQDIIPTLMPLLGSLIDLFAGMIEATGKTDTLTMEDLGAIASSDAMAEALIKLSGLEFVDFINITWALAKAADEDIDEPRVWVRQFDSFPVDVIAPAIFEMVLKGVVSSKNLKRLQSRMSGLKPSTSTTSSSQDSIED